MDAPVPQRSVVTLSCHDQPGIVHAVSGAIVTAQGNITESQQYSSPDSGRFFMRIEVEHTSSQEELRAHLRPVTERLGGQCEVDAADRPRRCLILVSTTPHCLHALLSRRRLGTLPIDVPMILSNHPDLANVADFYGLPFEWQPVSPATKPQMEDRIRQLVAEYDIELVVLARYMQILSSELSDELAGRAINIHHSFLPGFKGANPYRQAHARGVKLIGATAHFVTADLDEGPIIAQHVTSVNHNKTVTQLVEIGRDIESVTLAEAVRLFVQHRILLDGLRTVIFD
ncbi:MAG: formyltetrahydrofolate deformylase [Propionibacteriaceae bacterium]|nr:formyltetrahydrofolate deformylase [Propionibacteriaceae bacterium]